MAGAQLSPSFYLSAMERERARGDKMSNGLAGGVNTALGSMDILAELEQRLHGREVEAKNQKRADERFGFDKEANERAKAKGEDESVMRKLQRRIAEAQAARADRANKYEMQTDDEGQKAKIDAAFSGNAARLESMLGEPMASADAPAVPMSVKDQKAAQDLRAATLRADALERKAKGGVAPKANAPPSDKQRKDKALADIAESKAKALAGGVPKDSAQQQNRKAATGMAARLIESAQKNFEQYQSETSLPSSGITEGFRDIPGVSSLANPPSRVKFKQDIASLGLMIFPIIGRSDAPADREIRELIDVKLQSNAPAEVTRTRLAHLKELMNQSPTLNAPDDAPAGAPVPSLEEFMKD